MHGGWIDLLGLDENDAPVVVEYQRGTDAGMINQGLFYLAWLMDHRAECGHLARERLGAAAVSRVRWSAPRLICVAGDFTRYGVHAVREHRRSIDLVRYRFYGEQLVGLETVALPSRGRRRLRRGLQPEADWWGLGEGVEGVLSAGAQSGGAGLGVQGALKDLLPQCSGVQVGRGESGGQQVLVLGFPQDGDGLPWRARGSGAGAGPHRTACPDGGCGAPGPLLRGAARRRPGMVHWETDGKFGHHGVVSFCPKAPVSARSCCAGARSRWRSLARAVRARLRRRAGAAAAPAAVTWRFPRRCPRAGSSPRRRGERAPLPGRSRAGPPDSPYLMALISSPFAVSPLSSQKNVPPKPCWFLYAILVPMVSGVS